MIAVYLRERFRLTFFGPLALVLAAAALGRRLDGWNLAIQTLGALFLLAQFRIWDDLADRRKDAGMHPQRVLVRTASPAPVLGLGMALLALNVGLASQRDATFLSLSVLALLHAVLGVHYLRREGRTLLGDQLLLAKYPAFVCVLAGERLLEAPFAVAGAALVVYAGASAYEAWHDPASPLARSARYAARKISFGQARMTGRARTGRLRAGTPAMRFLHGGVQRERRGAEPHGIMIADTFETVACYLCGSRASREFVHAQDDLGGTPGRFRFVRCLNCGLAYQNPRVPLDRIGAYYDDTYIAHRKKRNWGVLTPLFERAMKKLDADKAAIVSRYVPIGPRTEVLDVGCAVGTFLAHLRDTRAARVAGVDFKDLSAADTLRDVEFHCGLFYDADLAANRFDLVTMWHFLEHDYDPMRSLATAHRVLKPGGTLVVEVPRLDSRTFWWFGDRWPGLQAPQHTVLYDRDALLRAVRKCGFETVDYLPYGAFPAYFYLFTGAAFRLLKGRGLNLDRAIVPYFIGQLLTLPVTLFEKRLNLAMQTVVCRRPL